MGGCRTVGIVCTFSFGVGGIVVGRFTCGKKVDHQNIFIINSVEVLILFNEKHPGLRLKLQVPLE